VRLSARKGFTAAVRLNVHGLSCISANAISKLGTLIDDKTRAFLFRLDIRSWHVCIRHRFHYYSIVINLDNILSILRLKIQKG